nr:alpha/beta hydrolase [uncultured Nocardioides sp.]
MTTSHPQRLPRLGLAALVAALALTSTAPSRATTGAEHELQHSAGATRAATAASKPTVVLVHGAWADASGWIEVTRGLQRRGYQVLAPPTPLRGLRQDADYLAAFLRDRTSGPVVLVGHSYAGAVITNAARSDKDVTALVYVNAFVPDEGDSVLGLLDPGHVLDPADLFDFVSPPGASEGDSDLYLKQEVFPDAIANGIPEAKARAMAAAERPITLSALTAASGRPAWKKLPSFYLLGTDDHIIPSDLQRAMAEHAGSRITTVEAGHLPMITDPLAVERIVVRASRTTARTAG